MSIGASAMEPVVTGEAINPVAQSKCIVRQHRYYFFLAFFFAAFFGEAAAFLLALAGLLTLAVFPAADFFLLPKAESQPSANLAFEPTRINDMACYLPLTKSDVTFMAIVLQAQFDRYCARSRQGNTITSRRFTVARAAVIAVHPPCQ